MTDKPSDEKEAERRFNETLGRLVNSPPKPHNLGKKLETESAKAEKERAALKSGPK
jgi:hypothetical protein